MARLREQELICTQNTEVPYQRGHMTRPRQLAFVPAMFRVEIGRTSSTEESPTKKFGAVAMNLVQALAASMAAREATARASA